MGTAIVDPDAVSYGLVHHSDPASLSMLEIAVQEGLSIDEIENALDVDNPQDNLDILMGAVRYILKTRTVKNTAVKDDE